MTSFHELTQAAIKSVDDRKFIECQGFYSIQKLEWIYDGGDYYATTIIEGYHVTETGEGFVFTYGDSAYIPCKSIQDGKDKCQAIFELNMKIHLNPEKAPIFIIDHEKLKLHKY